MRFTETDDLIDIRYDNMFKAVFTKKTPESLGALSALISSLIDRDVSIMTIAANEPPAENIRDRQIRFDIACVSKNGELINIEMSLYPNPYEPVKLEFYASKLFIGQDIRGDDKSYNDLKESYQIAILAKERFFADDSVFHTFEYYDPEQRISLNGRSRIITVELSKVGKIKDKQPEEMSKAEQWAYYLEHLTDRKKREKINKIMECQEGIAMASTVLSTISKDWEERCRLESELKYELDTQSWRVYIKKQVEEVDRKTEEAKRISEEADRKIEEAKCKTKEAERKTEDLQKVVADKDAEIARLRAELDKRV